MTALEDVIRPGTKRGLDFVVLEELRKHLAVEKETVVFVDNEYYGLCPKCKAQFDYTKEDVGKLFRCRVCFTLMKLKWKEIE